jgi:Ca2+-binding EF-hand superfamily protein
MFVKIPEKFMHLDEDKDGYVSIEEVSRAIDEFFNMTSALTIDDVYELTEFFFSQ